MHLTPSQAFEHIKESVVQYLETAYKIANASIFAERGDLLRERGTVAQSPFIEATPAFPTANKLADLERAHPNIVPAGLADLVRHGVPVDRFNLYTHQEESLLRAFSDQPNLLVATGTGSGKTECFLLPILADILREARNWEPTLGPYQPGRYDGSNDEWLHSRRHEARPAALRAIVLYPMNALVNDQLSRLRRILSRGDSPDWQRRNLRGNMIHFGMYTGLTQPTGSWAETWRRTKFAEYMQRIEADWRKLRIDLQETGNWPRPNSPEMLCRWDMQQAAPDILVTNYSMLEYMLVRPIEYGVFEQTRQWLTGAPDARFTLVLDEAHTYTGAKGTEVAHLIRRLKERLGIAPGSSQFRAIATTASVPAGADDQLRTFTSDLFDEPTERFSLIRLGRGALDRPQRTPTERALHAFTHFHDTFDVQDPWPAMEQLSQDLELGTVDRTLDPQVALFTLLESNDTDIAWVRQRTARNATLLDSLAEECWDGLGTQDEQERAVSGILAAGSFARPSALPDTPPLLSMRVHAFFRGISGVWACLNPDCPEVPDRLKFPDSGRPVGKIYLDPRPWCTPRCGARVLELFSCRHCGLLFLGGIPDLLEHSLWPWSDDLSGERQDLGQFEIFGVEQPHEEAEPEHRSVRTTLPTHPEDPFARHVYVVEPATQDNKVISPYPMRCPRCQNYRAPGVSGREVIEPLRTKGPRSFSIVVEDAFRVQPRAAGGQSPNYGRKALLFTDSRLEAAQLAADIRKDHHNDLFRQLAYRALHSCPECSGSGSVEEQGDYIIGQDQSAGSSNGAVKSACPLCLGTGKTDHPEPLFYGELRDRVVDMQLDLGINPTNGKLEDFFGRLDAGEQSCYDQATLFFDLALRRELSEDEFSLEPLGLASWHIRLPERVGAFPCLSEDETRLFLRSVARILATENILLPPEPHKPWDWPRDLLRDHERRAMIPGYKQQPGIVPYNLTNYRKLGRYVIAFSHALVGAGRLPDDGAAQRWLQELRQPLWDAITSRSFNVLQIAGKKVGDHYPRGIRVDSFELHPLAEKVQQCRSCSYVMSETLLNVCLRCGGRTAEVPVGRIDNYYRRAAVHSLPGSGFDDPYPLRAIEHTAQIPGHEARDIERWFQDLFHDEQHPNDYRVDILSVTTTMEMGIDIGSLLSVGLRNVPPTVANYQQRAGRAGRRGSSIATVLTFAQFRSHDQYYFSRPPEIVSDPPRVPALYLNNEVIARRHVRSLVLQNFFHSHLYGQRLRRTSGLFSSWGSVEDFINKQTATRLQQFLSANRAPLVERCRKIVRPEFHAHLDAWLTDMVAEVQHVVGEHEMRDGLLESLINSGLLPKYAFPVDVVGLSIPILNFQPWADESAEGDTTSMQRDLKIALAEYAPGAEVIRGEFPNTYIYRSAGVYDPFAKEPDYSPTGILVECGDCQAVSLIEADEQPTDRCEECGSFNVTPLPYLRPTGFTVDAALPNAGREEYEGGGRERAGSTSPARLLVGQSSFTSGTAYLPTAPNLYTYVRRGHLFACNKGPDRNFPGFLICPSCGRALDPENLGTHTYPADVPPRWGAKRGPRSGSQCPNTKHFTNQVILGDPFYSEVILLGVDLPPSMDAPFSEPSGKAVWYSFGTLLANAAAFVLQVDPGELKVGVRPVRRSPGRVHGEVFLYDDVPGGAGYAHAIRQNLDAILQKALEIGGGCKNPNCSGACYHCMYDYRNQMLHPLLDRELGASVLRYLLCNEEPSLDPAKVQLAVTSLVEFARENWQINPSLHAGDVNFECVLQDRTGTKVGVWAIHPLQARPTAAKRQAILAQHGIRCAVHSYFDLERRPFWVLNHLVTSG